MQQLDAAAHSSNYNTFVRQGIMFHYNKYVIDGTGRKYAPEKTPEQIAAEKVKKN